MAVQAGAASTPPWALALIFFGWSKPIQTPVTRSGVKPMNQTSNPSLVVPVLPPAGKLIREPTEPTAVPWRTTSRSASVMSQACAVSMTDTERTCGCQTILPLRSSTRRMALGMVRVPEVGEGGVGRDHLERDHVRRADVDGWIRAGSAS